MLFKGTATRTAEDIAQEIDSIGGQLDAFTAKEYASYYIKVLDEHLPRAVDILSDIVLHPAFDADDIEREKKVILEEIKMVEDTPDDLVHELFTQSFWEGHPLGRPILGHARDGGGARRRTRCASYFASRLHRRQLRDLGGGQPRARAASATLVEKAFARHRADRRRGCATSAPRGRARTSRFAARTSSRATSAWAPARYPQSHDDRYVELRAEHAARRVDELAPVPERAREARPGLRGVQRPERVPRRRAADDLRRLRERGGRRR